MIRTETILKMNFNFNFKDIPALPDQSIRGLTTRVIRITLRNSALEMLRDAGKRSARSTIASRQSVLWGFNDSYPEEELQQFPRCLYPAS